MHNQPGRGPTRTDKTNERMKQERASPGATTAGGTDAASTPSRTRADATLSVAGKDLETSDNTASRRADRVGDAQPPAPTTERTVMKDFAQAIDKPMVVESRSREDRIRAAAYRRYQARGEVGGDPSADWLEAEAEIDAEARDT